MNSTLAAVAAFCLLGAPAAQAGSGYLFHDYGTGLAGLGVAPAPVQGYSPDWGGKLTTWGGGFFGPRGSTDEFGGGVVHAEVVTLENDDDLTPAGYQSSGLAAFGQNDDDAYSVAGFASGSCAGACVAGPLHAAYWVYSGASGTWAFSDLHPAGYAASLAQGANDVIEVGWGQDGANVYHPLAWQGTAASATVLPLTGALTQGAAAAVASNKSSLIVGWGNGADNVVHPIAWTPGRRGGYAVTDLLPSGATFGVAVATDANYIGGSVVTPSSGGQFHAAYWYGAAAGTFTDIHPAPIGKTTYIASSVYAATIKFNTKTAYLAGLAVVDNRSRTGHAMLWVGPTFKAIDLQKGIGSGFVASVATGVDGGGNVSGSALDTSGVWHKVYWSRN